MAAFKELTVTHTPGYSTEMKRFAGRWVQNMNVLVGHQPHYHDSNTEGFWFGGVPRNCHVAEMVVPVLLHGHGRCVHCPGTFSSIHRIINIKVFNINR